MKTKCYFLIAAMLLMVNCIFAQTKSASFLLTNAKTNKSINILAKYDPDKVEAILGKAITLDKDVYDKDTSPEFTFNYDGLVILMQDNMVKQITITNKKWKLNSFTIGSLLETVVAKHEKIGVRYKVEHRFKIKDSKGVLTFEIDNLQRITKLGVVF